MLRQKPRLIVFTLLFASVYFHNLLGAENNPAEDTSQTTSDAEQPLLTPTFSVDLKQLAINNTADDLQWIDSENIKHLLLIHSAKGRKPRGNVLILHAQGENPDHQRFIQPISRQLARLGWKVFIPSFAIENFAPQSPQTGSPQTGSPQTGSAQTETAQAESKEQTNPTEPVAATDQQQSTTAEKSQQLSATNHYFFKTSTEYQNYYQKICEAVLQQSEIKNKPLFIIANQNSAYWGLSCLKLLPATSAIIFIEPQLPNGVKNDLEQRFAKYRNPYFSFHAKNTVKDPFMLAFKKQVWRTKYLRFNIGMYSGNKLAIEDNQLAKTITGWLDRQHKNNN